MPKEKSKDLLEGLKWFKPTQGIADGRENERSAAASSPLSAAPPAAIQAAPPVAAEEAAPGAVAAEPRRISLRLDVAMMILTAVVALIVAAFYMGQSEPGAGARGREPFDVKSGAESNLNIHNIAIVDPAKELPGELADKVTRHDALARQEMSRRVSYTVKIMEYDGRARAFERKDVFEKAGFMDVRVAQVYRAESGKTMYYLCAGTFAVNDPNDPEIAATMRQIREFEIKGSPLYSEINLTVIPILLPSRSR